MDSGGRSLPPARRERHDEDAGSRLALAREGLAAMAGPLLALGPAREAPADRVSGFGRAPGRVEPPLRDRQAPAPLRAPLQRGLLPVLRADPGPAGPRPLRVVDGWGRPARWGTRCGADDPAGSPWLDRRDARQRRLGLDFSADITRARDQTADAMAPVYERWVAEKPAYSDIPILGRGAPSARPYATDGEWSGAPRVRPRPT